MEVVEEHEASVLKLVGESLWVIRYRQVDHQRLPYRVLLHGRTGEVHGVFKGTQGAESLGGLSELVDKWVRRKVGGQLDRWVGTSSRLARGMLISTSP